MKDKLVATLRKYFPYGHPRFIPILIEMMDLHSRKNRDYAASDLGHSPLGNFTRVAQILALYPGLKLSDPRVVACVYRMKQLDQTLFSLSIGREGAVEGMSPRYRDQAVYTVIEEMLNEDMVRGTTSHPEAPYLPGNSLEAQAAPPDAYDHGVGCGGKCGDHTPGYEGIQYLQRAGTAGGAEPTSCP